MRTTRSAPPAIILCGGRGERLRPLTDDRPKPMVEINGRPIIAYQLGWLQKHSITEIVLACGYRWQVIRSFLGDGASWGLNIRYTVETKPLGRGGGIRLAMEALGAKDGPVIVINGDTLIGVDLHDLVESHSQSRALATIVLSPLVSARGIVRFDDDGWVSDFEEKPELPYWINAGLYVFARRVAAQLPVIGDHEDSLFPSLAAQNKLHAYPTRTLWRTVDTAKDLSTLTEEVRSGLALPYIAPLASSRSAAKSQDGDKKNV